MDQHVPVPLPTRVGIIGAGRVSRAIANACRRSGLQVVGAWARGATGRQRFASEFDLPGPTCIDDVVRGCDVVIVAVPDAQYLSVLDDLAPRIDADRPPLVVLTSGSASVTLGSALGAVGARIVRIHPLQGITDTAPPDTMDGVVAAITAVNDADLVAARELAVRLGLVAFDLRDEDAPIWHAAGTLAAGGVTTLLAAARDLAVEAGMSSDAALIAMGSLARTAIDRAVVDGPEAALTGPIVRGDTDTVAAHVAALRDVRADLVAPYEAVAGATVALARRAGRIGRDRGFIVVERVDALREALAVHRAAGHRIGFVPTMGALHDGHTELVRAARRECDVVVTSCFVNPTQFQAGEDLDRYPHTPESDEIVAREAGTDVLWRPHVSDIYGDDAAGAVQVHVGRLGTLLEGRSRPGHFDGVATVVVRLLAAVGPDVLYLGEKDFQQAVVLRRVVHDLLLPVDVVVVPTVREADGLARSSRNAYLTVDDRAYALAISRTIRDVERRIADGERAAAELLTTARDALRSAPGIDLDYAELVDATGLGPVERIGERDCVLLIAARVGTTRLIDNLPIPSTCRSISDDEVRP